MPKAEQLTDYLLGLPPQLLLEKLRDDVTGAEDIRQRKAAGEELSYSERVSVFFELWTDNDLLTRLTKKLEGESVDNFPVSEAELVLAIGILGLARIAHVDANTDLLVAKIIGNPELISSLFAGVLRVIKKVNEIFSKFTSPPDVTIHGDRIHWQIEHAQDEGRTAELLGDPETAAKHYTAAIDTAKNYIRISTDPKQIAAAKSAQAVNFLRLGRMTGSLPLVWRGVWQQRSSMQEIPNEQRLLDLTKMAAEAALGEKRGLQLFPRFKILAYATLYLGSQKFKNAIYTLSTKLKFPL